ncbi:MAG: protein kinase [Candidatus Obscuribacterales bacterium]|nr:protein kinase [Candidatus Obscuribacterales bacterium]
MAGSVSPDGSLSSVKDTSSGPLLIETSPAGERVDSGAPVLCEPGDKSGSEGKQSSSCPPLQTFDPAQNVFELFRPGDIVGERYRVQSLIGHGGMGMVYKVEQIYLGKELALKILHSRSATDVTVRRFHHEAQAVFGIDHPSLISVHDFGLLDQRIPFLVMDYVQGCSLADRIKMQGTLTVHEAVPIFLRICFGLGYAHDHGVIHRDVKPSNIMLSDGMSPSEDGCVKIVDFGIAKFTQLEASDVQALTRTGEVFGSPLYMSPEQCSGSSVDQRSDIYSLGCVFFEVLTGTTPFVGANALSTMMRHMGENPPTLKEASLGKDFPPLLEQIISRMLAKRASERYQNLSQVAVDLAALERSMVDPVLMANTVLVLDKPKEVKDESGMVSMSRPALFLLAALVVAVSSTLSSLITASLNDANLKAKAAETPARGKSKTPADLKLVHIDEAKQFVKSLETKTGRPEVSSKAIYEAIHNQAESGKLSMRYIDVTETTLSAVARARWIESLDLLGCGVDNSKLSLLRQIPRLSKVTLSNSTLDDSGAAALSKCPRIESLNVSWSNITAESVPYFTAMPNLKYLEIGGISLTPFAIKNLANDTRLKNLDLRGIIGVDDDCFAPMVDSSLLFLNVESIPIGDKAAGYFGKMRNLFAISIGGTNISPRGVEALLMNGKAKTITYTTTPYLKREDILTLVKKYPLVRFCEGNRRGGDS